MATTSIDTMSLPSEALGMGNPVAEYRSGAVMPWLVAAILGILGLGVLALGGYSLLEGDDGAWVGALFGLLLIAGAAWQLYVGIRDRDLRVVVLEKGVVRVGGGERDILPWDDITGVYQAVTVHYTNGIKTRTTHVYTVWRRDSTKVVFNDRIKNVEALGTTIQKEVTSRLMPRYAESYNAGNTVNFNKLSLSKAGISNGKETIPWDQVQEVKINQGVISVRKQGKWLNWAGQSAAATPNLFIFLSLVDQIVGLNKKRA